MRVSIWQQFSSNHSGFFWVAGTFNTVEEARAGYDELRRILYEIDRWHREHKEESAASSRAGKYKASPPEAMFALEYNVEWPHTIDWTGFAEYFLEDNPVYASLGSVQARPQERIDDAVAIIGRVVTVNNPDQTWMTTQPFQDLLERFGAQTVGYNLETIFPEDFEIHSVARFTAPNAATADQIEKAIRTYLTNRMSLSPEEILPPWHDDEANFRQILGASRYLRQQDIEILKQSWQRRYRLHTHPYPSPTGLDMPSQRLELKHSGMVIVRDHFDFSLTDIWFHNQELGLSALFAYLEVNGCTNIDFEYVAKLGDQE